MTGIGIAVALGLVVALGIGVAARRPRRRDDAWIEVGRRLGLALRLEEDAALATQRTVLHGSLAGAQVTLWRDGERSHAMLVEHAPPLGVGLSLSWRAGPALLTGLAPVRVDALPDVDARAVDPEAARALLERAVAALHEAQQLASAIRVTDGGVLFVLEGEASESRFTAAASGARALAAALFRAARETAVVPWRDTMRARWAEDAAQLGLTLADEGRRASGRRRGAVVEASVASDPVVTEVHLRVTVERPARPTGWRIDRAGDPLLLLGSLFAVPRPVELAAPLHDRFVELAPAGPRVGALPGAFLDALAKCEDGLLRVEQEPRALALVIDVRRAYELARWIDRAVELARALDGAATPDAYRERA